MFQSALSGFRTLVAEIKPDQWEQPGLGEWSVRELVGHTSRAMLTVVDYLQNPVATPAELPDEVAYFRTSLRSGDNAQLHAKVLRRGREAGIALGSDPVAYVDDLCDRLVQTLGLARSDTVVKTPAGTIRLHNYLPTRTFELTVHSLDIAHATDLELPKDFEVPMRESGALCVALAQADDVLPDVLMALLGRTTLPAGFTLL